MCVETVIQSVQIVADVAKAVYDVNRQIKANNNVVNASILKGKEAQAQAVAERQEGIENSRKEKLKSILAAGDLETNIASGNISLSSQTAANILETEKLNGENDALTTLKSANKRADSYMQRAREYYENAQLTSFNTKSLRNRFWLNSIADNAGPFSKVIRTYKEEKGIK